ncbi:DNA repair photolyase [Melghirimyces profundicolus]|uniref:DNA repair photolyase n=1 Tax=Melghirimyces profundicolus TaxID=1242148 RepID=A0A2T6BGD5_9BACL|nr:radical SAM protein [Melghirimyces profundicolus]PTX55128.1 DNA repair photolyase [Melghirimyces profundicolus]
MKNGQQPDRWFPARPKSVLNRVTDKRMPFKWSINPYRGCGHGCHFCYARATHVWLGFHADDSFRNNIYVKRDAASVLRSELKRGKWKGGGIAIGTATDPYQQLEGKLGITRSILEVLREFGIPCGITTRSPLILRDLDLLQKMKVTSVNVSISTLDETIWKKTEPSSPHPRQRLKTVRELNRAGVPAGVFLAPILPYLTDSEVQLKSLVEAAAEHEARFVVPSVLRLRPEVKSWFFRQMHPAFPGVYPSLVRLYQDGARAPEDYRSALLERVGRLAEEAGLPTRIPPQEEQEGPRSSLSGQKPATGEAPVQLSLF